MDQKQPETCDVCGKEISKRAEACPHCGDPKYRVDQLQGCFNGILKLMVAGAV